jgi:hypothetical protein
LATVENLSLSEATDVQTDSSELEDSSENLGDVPKGNRDGNGAEQGGRLWGQLRESLRAIEQTKSIRWKERHYIHPKEDSVSNGAVPNGKHGPGPPDLDNNRSGEDGRGQLEDSQDDEFCDATESIDVLHEVENNAPAEAATPESSLEEELKNLVRGGVPMALRGEVQLNCNG